MDFSRPIQTTKYCMLSTSRYPYSISKHLLLCSQHSSTFIVTFWEKFSKLYNLSSWTKTVDSQRRISLVFLLSLFSWFMILNCDARPIIRKSFILIRSQREISIMVSFRLSCSVLIDILLLYLFSSYYTFNMVKSALNYIRINIKEWRQISVNI